MKKQAQFLCMMALIAIMGLTSCTKKPEDLIVGKWKITNYQMYKDDGEEIPLPGATGETWTFTENGSFTGWCRVWQNQIDNYLDSRYIVDDEELTIRGGNFVFGDEECVFVFDINEITKEKLTISGKWKYYKWKDNFSELEGIGSLNVSLKRK